MTHPTYSQVVNLTLNITYKDGQMPEMPSTLAWIMACLNCNTNRASVEIEKPTGFLGWPDFMDPPGPGEEEDAKAVLKDLEDWLAMDRKQLISALLRQRNEAQAEKISREHCASRDAKKARALDSVTAKLGEMGFGSNEPINGGDCVESIDQLYQRLLKMFPELRQQPEA